MIYYISKGLFLIIGFFAYRIRVFNVDKLNNAEGPIIVCSNHTHFFDPVLLASYCKPPIHFMSKKELFENKYLAWYLRHMHAFPVDRKAGFGAMKQAIKLLRSGKILGIFPEGTRVTGFDINNAKSGVSMIAKTGKARVVPVYIDAEFRFRGHINLYYGEPKDYFENIEGKVTSEMHEEISRQILTDIYNLKPGNNY